VSGKAETQVQRSSRPLKAVSVDLSPAQVELLDRVAKQVPLLSRHRLMRSIIVQRLYELDGDPAETLHLIMEEL
jgi:hypothetical protein